MKYFKAIKLQLLIFLAITVFILFSHFDILPDSVEIQNWFLVVLNSYGSLALFLLSFGENLAGLNVYFPGSIAILIGMANTHGNIELAISAFLAIFIGSFISNFINLLLSRSLSSKISTRISYLEALVSLWHPHFASLVSMRMGRHKDGLGDFFTIFLPVSLIWNIVWAIFIYNMGSIVSLNDDNGWMNIIFFLYLIIWIIYDLYQVWKKNKLSSK